MVPSALVLLPALPRNANGKIDRAALPEPGEARPRHEPIAPRTPIEEAVAEVWHTVLKRQPTDVTESFFDLGGNSLLATQVVSRLRARFEIELPLRRFFEGSTIEALAAVVDEALLARLESMSEEEAAELLARWSRPAAFDSAP